MKLLKVFIFFTLLSFFCGSAQQSIIYTHDLVDYNHAMQLYSNKDYVASQLVFTKIKNTFDQASELRARSYYYEAFCAIRLKQKNADELMNAFFEKFPTSTKRNTAFLEVGDYYFNDNKLVGLKTFLNANTFVRAEANYTEYDKISGTNVTTSGGAATSTTVSGTPYLAQGIISIGYQF